MKPVIALDLSLLAVPCVVQTSEEVEAILTRIRSWALAMERQDCIDFAMVTDAVENLGRANCFPATHNVRALLELHQLDGVFSPNDVNTRIFSILQKAQRLSDVLGVEALLFERSSITGVDIPVGANLHLVESFELLLASIALAKNDMVRVSTACHAERAIHIEGIVHVAEGDALSIEDEGIKVSSDIAVVHDPDSYLETLEASKVWGCSSDSKQLHLAISLEVADLLKVTPNGVPLRDVPTFCIGSEFMASLNAHGASGQGTLANLVRSKCAQVLVSKSQAEPKSFSSKRRGDAADSFRVHLSKDHAAFRLMYWVRPDGSVEFANIGVKKELIIVEGDHQQHIAARYN